MSKDKTASEIIDGIGGTGATALLCGGISAASVSDWRKYGIPSARLMFLKLARPDVFKESKEKLEKV